MADEPHWYRLLLLTIHQIFSRKSTPRHTFLKVFARSVSLLKIYIVAEKSFITNVLHTSRVMPGFLAFLLQLRYNVNNCLLEKIRMYTQERIAHSKTISI